MSISEGSRWLGNITADVSLDPQISATAKAVYLVLAVHADNDAYCFPSRERICDATGVSLATCKRALAELERQGVIRREPRFAEGRQTSNGYVLLDIVAIRGARQ